MVEQPDQGSGADEGVRPTRELGSELLTPHILSANRRTRVGCILTLGSS
jgi:hypothetical protein